MSILGLKQSKIRELRKADEASGAYLPFPNHTESVFLSFLIEEQASLLHLKHYTNSIYLKGKKSHIRMIRGLTKDGFNLVMSNEKLKLPLENTQNHLLDINDKSKDCPVPTCWNQNVYRKSFTISSSSSIFLGMVAMKTSQKHQ